MIRNTWESFKKSWYLMIPALFFALILWCYVIAGTNPVRSKELDNIPLSLINATELNAKGFTIDESLSDIIDKVDIRVEANVNAHRNITSDTVRATVNLAEINETGKVTLNVNAISTLAGVSVKSVSPSRITLTVDKLRSREIPVTWEMTGEPPTGYYVSDPVFSKDTVTISGPEKNIGGIVRAVCRIPIQEIRENTTKSYALTLYNEAGEEVPLSSVSGDLPSVIAELKVLPTKFVAIRDEDIIAAVTNVKPGYEITGVVAEPSILEIAAEQSVLDGINTVRIQPLNLGEADKSVMLDAPLQPIDDIEYISRTSVEILVQIDEIRAEKTFRNQKIVLRNLEDGFKASLTSTKYCDVTIRGGQSAIEKLSAEDIRLFVDMASMQKPGTYTLPIAVESLPGGVEVTLSVKEATVLVSK